VYRFEYLSIEVLRLAVAPEFRRMGIGGALLAAVVRKLEQTAQRRLATLRVPEELLDAQLWLKAMGWRCVDVDDGCYVFEVRSRNDGRMEGGRDVGAWQEDR